jgi:hypothetical protein
MISLDEVDPLSAVLGAAAPSAPGAPLEEGPGFVGEVNVLVVLAETLPEAGPRLRRVGRSMPHAGRLVVPELAAVGAGTVALALDGAGRATGVGLIGVAFHGRR